MPEFPHLPLRSALQGDFNFGQTPRNPNPRTLQNLQNRRQHGDNLSAKANGVANFYQDVMKWREENGLPELPSADIIPVYLRIDPGKYDLEFLKGFGIEIIAEEDDGYIIGASVDGFKSLRDKIKKFVETDKAKNTAELWDIIDGNGWRAEQIFSEGLYQKWQENNIHDDEVFTVDVSIACYLKKSNWPSRTEDETDEHYDAKVQRWQERSAKYDIARDELEWARQDEVQKFIELHGGAITSQFMSYEDSFGFRAEMNGQALKDLVLNYPYVFEVTEYADIEDIEGEEGESELDLNLIAPVPSSPKVCVIDSGIQENHKLLSKAVLNSLSVSFVPGEHDTTSDQVRNGGHGTKVAGAVLFGNNIPEEGDYQLPCFIYNARVLDSDNSMSSRLFPPKLMKDISSEFSEADIYNLSITGRVPCRQIHMSQWAATLDQIAHEEGKLFVISAGNIKDEGLHPNNPGIKDYLQAGRAYPQYLLERSCRIADPAQSAFSLTVGSVCLDRFEDEDRISFGAKDEVSSFSRSGLGMWGAIKPEVVEYGGDWIRERNGENFTVDNKTSSKVVKAGAGGVGYDIGTSFAAPKVGHIAAHLVRLFPAETSLFHKALIIQSARHPEAFFSNPTANHIRHYGYGIPSLERAIQNNAQRITFTTSGKLNPAKAHLFSVNIPEEMRRQGEDYDILIEVSLCYTAKPRRTRRNLRSYLSAWLSWQSAKLNQSFAAFKQDVLKSLQQEEQPTMQEATTDESSIPWFLTEHPTHGKVRGVKRQASANQKDWAIVKSYNLSQELSFAVVGHKGWEKDMEQEIPYTFVVSFEVLGAELQVYELMQQVNVEVEQRM